MTQPTKWSTPLGSGADVQDLPDDDLRYASFSKIFPQITQVPLSAGGVAPRRIDFNSLFKLLADNIYYYQNGGVFEYSDTADYEKGAIVRYNDKIYLCIQDNSALNLHNPDDMDYWLRVALNNELSDYLPLTGGNVTGNLTVQNKNVVRTINDVEADFNGNVVLEIGTSKADIDLSNVTAPVQNFKNMSIGWSMPDYSASILVPFSSAQFTYTAPSNGFLWFNAFGERSTVTINGTTYDVGGNDSYNEGQVFIPLNKNDNIRATTDSNIYFIPCKGVN